MSATDEFAGFNAGLTSPISRAAEVTPSNSEDLETATRGLYVGAAGDVKVTLVGGDTVTLVDLVAGVIHPLRVSRVWATGTEATGIVALW